MRMNSTSEQATLRNPRPLGEVLIRHNEIIHPGDRKGGEAIFVGLEHIEPGTGRRLGSLSIDLAKLTGRKPTFRRGQIVYGYLRPYLNKVWIAEFDGCSSVDQFAFEVRRELAEAEFVAAFMRSETFLRRSQVVTTTGQLPRISVDEIARVPIDLPPLPRQKQVVARLEQALIKAYAAKRAATERLAAAEALPAALLRETFDSPAAMAWNPIALGRLTETCSGSTPPRGQRGYFGGQIPWVKTGELKDGIVASDGKTDEMLTELALEECVLPRLPAGTLLVAMYGQGQTRGRTGLLACEATTNQACFAILPRPAEFSSSLLQLWFRANYARLRMSTENRGGNQPNLNGDLLRRLEVRLPDDVAVQNRIAESLTKRLDAAESVVRRCREELAQVEALPAALLREAFNGASESGLE